MSASLAEVLSPEALLRLAGPRSYERGEAYLDAGRVSRLETGDDRATAIVQGTRRYRVELHAIAGGELHCSCTCPMAASGAVCKHCVAVGLAALGEGAQPAASGPPALSAEDVGEYLEGLDRTELVSLLLDEAGNDERLLDGLRLRAAGGGTGAVNLATFRDAIDLAVDPGEAIHYGEAFDYSRRIGEVIDGVERLLDSGHADEVVELADYSLAAVEEIIGMVDDSDGELGVIFDRLQRLHREACGRAELDGVELAERLFERMLSGEMDLFYDAIRTYAPVLGPEGRERYAELARAEWAQLPELGPGDERDYGPRFRITHVMELLAEQGGDVDELVAVMRRNLSLPYGYLRIAEAYRSAAREDDALEWAEQGIEAFPDRRDSRLTEFLADAYRRRERHADALELMWAAFADQPGLEAYTDLKPYAERAGEWPERRDRALRLLRERTVAATAEIRRRGYGWSPYRDSSEVVRILLSEGDPEGAWREAQEGGCGAELWLELAELRAESHPEDAVAVYRDRVEPIVDRKTKAAYADAVSLIAMVKELMTRLGQEDEFGDYLEQIRATHRRKRNFMKLLDELEPAEPARG